MSGLADKRARRDIAESCKAGRQAAAVSEPAASLSCEARDVVRGMRVEARRKP